MPPSKAASDLGLHLFSMSTKVAYGAEKVKLLARAKPQLEETRESKAKAIVQVFSKDISPLKLMTTH